jgi:hypothetical protein
VSRPAALRALPLFPLVLFGIVAVGLFAVAQASVAWLPFAPVPPHGFPDYDGFEGFTRWDTGWYWYIAKEGYWYGGPGIQSPVAFFPAYPFTMRLAALVIGDELWAGVLITFACGIGAVVLFHRWSRDLLGEATARVAVLLLVLYPFAFYLFGVVYSDALFLLAALAAFSFVERGHPWLAGVAGAVATAARPVGVALVVGLVLVALERRGVLERGRLVPVPRLRRLDWRDLGVLVSLAGLGAYCVLLWRRFDEPFAFSKVGDAEGWARKLTFDGVIKLDFWRIMAEPELSAAHVGLALQGLLTVGALILVPFIVHRLGWGYGAYTAAVVLIPAVTSKDFIGMGRYVLVAFPVFAVVGDVLVRRRVPRGVLVGVLACSAFGLVLMHSLFSRWYFLS